MEGIFLNEAVTGLAAGLMDVIIISYFATLSKYYKSEDRCDLFFSCTYGLYLLLKLLANLSGKCLQRQK